MRIAVANWSRRRAGGAEYYLAAVIPALENAGHSVAMWHELDRPVARELIVPENGAPTFGAEAMGPDKSLSALREWAPDLLYCHGILEPRLERRVLDMAPAVFFAHGFYGTCISGDKTWKFPVVHPCRRRFGWPCLVHFYPHRCGGLNPFVMARQYRLQGARLGLLSRYAAIVTHSRRMQHEYLRHDFSPECVHRVRYPVAGAEEASPAAQPTERRGAWRLVFTGRMNHLKGGQFLIDALPHVRRDLNAPIEVTFAGDGPQRAEWERLAVRLEVEDHDISINFTGWLERTALDAVLASADLLVFPSIWPEPFGQVGPEAGLRGVPVAAFASGGIPDWLEDGVNGFTAPADPPRATELAEAIVRCLRDPSVHTRLRQGALAAARRYTMAGHLADLLPILERAAGSAE